MNWKRGLVTVLLVSGLVAAGAAYIRIADMHAPPSDQRLDTGRAPQAIIDQARAQFRTVEYRSVVRVYRVDSSGERTPAYVFEDVYDYSDRQFVANYLTVDSLESMAPPHYHFRGLFHGATDDDESSRSLWYLTDARTVVGGGNATEYAVGKYAVEDPWSRRASFNAAYANAVFLNHTADWRVVEENDSTLVLGIDDPHEYYKTRLMWKVEDVHEGSSIRVTVDKDAARITRIVEHRVVTKEVYVTGTDKNGTDYERYEHRRVHYLIETQFSDYGKVDLERPDGIGQPTLRQYAYDLLDY